MEWLRRRRHRKILQVTGDLLAQGDLSATVSPGTPEAVVVESVLLGGFSAAGLAATVLPFLERVFQRSSAGPRKAFGVVCSLAVLARWLGLPGWGRRAGGILPTMPNVEWVFAIVGVFGGMSENDLERYSQLMSVARENLKRVGKPGSPTLHPMDQVFLADALAVLENKPLPTLPREFLQLKTFQSLAESGFPLATWDVIEGVAFKTCLTTGTRHSFEYWRERVGDMEAAWDAQGLFDDSSL